MILSYNIETHEADLYGLIQLADFYKDGLSVDRQRENSDLGLVRQRLFMTDAEKKIRDH